MRFHDAFNEEKFALPGTTGIVNNDIKGPMATIHSSRTHPRNEKNLP
jgi:hypothetical protein